MGLRWSSDCTFEMRSRAAWWAIKNKSVLAEWETDTGTTKGRAWPVNNMCPSLTFRVQLTILAILRIWYRLKGLCLMITVSNTEEIYSCYLCQYHHIEKNAWSIMNGGHDKYKGNNFLSIYLRLIWWDNLSNIWYIYITNVL